MKIVAKIIIKHFPNAFPPLNDDSLTLNLTSIFFKTNPTSKGPYRPIDKITFFRDNLSNFLKSQIIVEGFVHNIPKFEAVLVLYNFE